MNELGKLTLWRIIKVMFLILFVAFVYVLLSGTRVNGLYDKQPKKKFGNINIGETVLRTHKGQRVWVTRISEQQRRQYSSVTTQVVTEGGCDPNANLCVLVANTNVAGINISFAKEAPPQLPNNVAWVSGFVNPTSGAVYDLWGRAYRFSEVASLNVTTLE